MTFILVLRQMILVSMLVKIRRFKLVLTRAVLTTVYECTSYMLVNTKIG